MNINNAIRIVSKEAPPSNEEISKLHSFFGEIPKDYMEFIGKYGESEIMWREFGYLRIWRLSGCIDMYMGYGMAQYIKGCFPFADNGGGSFLAYCQIDKQDGVYKISYSDIGTEDATFMSNDLASIIVNGLGIELIEDR